MDEKAIKPKSGSSIPESAFNSPITELEIPTSVHKLLEGSGYVNVGDIMLQVAEDEKQILAVRGIGPKILEQIIFAIKEFEFPEDNSIQIEHPKYNSPVPSQTTSSRHLVTMLNLLMKTSRRTSKEKPHHTTLPCHLWLIILILTVSSHL